jgi:2-(1,2-epoxy-1,2-dihydrophenyl)acetyl-CoA isomerase
MALVEYAVHEGVGHITLNRPDRANAFDLETATTLAAVVERVGHDPQVRSVVLSGTGPRFCAGGDVASFAAASDQSAYIHRLAIELDKAFHALSALDKPVAAAVHGAVAGAGLALMLTCDIVVAEPQTRFLFAYPGIGLTPDCGLSYLLPRAIGQQRALSFALLGIAASAEDAAGWGLVTEVADDPQGRAFEVARAWANGPAGAFGQVRRLLRARDLDRGAMGLEEARTISEMSRGLEARTLISRFTNS